MLEVPGRGEGAAVARVVREGLLEEVTQNKGLTKRQPVGEDEEALWKLRTS